MGKLEIKVTFANLEEAARKLREMADSLENRKLSPTLVKCEGDTAEELIALAEKLETFGKTFGHTVRSTAEKLAFTARSFRETDENLKY